jgi:hypothetical protein
MLQTFFDVVNVYRNTRATISGPSVVWIFNTRLSCTSICIFTTAGLDIGIRLLFFLLLEKMSVFVVWIRLIEDIMKVNVN